MKKLMTIEEFEKWAKSKAGKKALTNVLIEACKINDELKEERRINNQSLKDFVVNI